jgi:ABC-type multidrug transport system permease subunit
MRFTALKTILAAVVVTTAAQSAHIAKAETTLSVPFSFNVSGQSMPAGVYTVQEDKFHNLVILRNKAGNKSFSYTLRPGDPAPGEVHVALKFESQGDSHILRGIQYGSRTTSRLEDGRAPYEPSRLSQGR